MMKFLQLALERSGAHGLDISIAYTGRVKTSALLDLLCTHSTRWTSIVVQDKGCYLVSLPCALGQTLSGPLPALQYATIDARDSDTGLDDDAYLKEVPFAPALLREAAELKEFHVKPESYIRPSNPFLENITCLSIPLRPAPIYLQRCSAIHRLSLITEPFFEKEIFDNLRNAPQVTLNSCSHLSLLGDFLLDLYDKP